MSPRNSRKRPVHARSATAPLSGRRYVVCNWRDSAHPRAGGAEVYCEQVAARLAALGAEVVFLTSRSEGAPARENTHYGRVVRLGGTLTTYPLGLAWLARQRRRIDGVIDSENGIPYFSPLAVGRATPVVLIMHHVHQEQFSLYFSPTASKVARWLEKTAAAWVYGRRPVCVVSPSTRAAVRRDLSFKGPIFVAPNGTERPPADRAARRPVPTIVCVGRLVRHKRMDLLVRALPELLDRFPDLTVDIVGDGPDRPELEALGKELGVTDALRFHGRLDDAERDRVVRSSWLAVNPSGGEGWGLSILEAASHGVPAVAFRVAGLRDCICDGVTGWLCDSEEDLAAVITRALGAVREPAEADSFADACRRWADRYSWDRTAALIQSVLASEQERIGSGFDDRRSRNDVATLVGVEAGGASSEAMGRFRRTDRVRVNDGRVELLLCNADEMDAAVALSRAGIDRQAVKDKRLARLADLLGWDTVSRAGPLLRQIRPGGDRSPMAPVANDG